MANPIMDYFEYNHLPQPQRDVSSKFYHLATAMNITMPDGAEKSAGLRKLLEAKDCMVRASLKK